MSTLQRIEAISKELAGMANKEDFVFVYGELLHRIRENIERRGYTREQAFDQLQVLAGFEALSVAEEEIEKLEARVEELEEDEGDIKDLRERLDRIQTIASY